MSCFKITKRYTPILLFFIKQKAIYSLNKINYSNTCRYFSDGVTGVGDNIHPDFQTSYKTGDINLVKKQIEDDVKNNKVFVFIKGTPQMPQCGFSKNLITILDYLQIKYNTRDVLSHPALRQAIKEYSDWPTFPQLFYKGELIGGHDIVVDMFKNGELHQLFGIDEDNDDDHETENGK